MAAVHIDEPRCFVVLAKDSRDPVLRVMADGADALAGELIIAADELDRLMRVAGRIYEPQEILTEVWEVKVGYFDGGVALQFNLAGQHVPLPIAVARALAGRLRAAAIAARTGTTVVVAGRNPTKVFEAQVAK